MCTNICGANYNTSLGAMTKAVVNYITSGDHVNIK